MFATTRPNCLAYKLQKFLWPTKQLRLVLTCRVRLRDSNSKLELWVRDTESGLELGVNDTVRTTVFETSPCRVPERKCRPTVIDFSCVKQLPAIRVIDTAACINERD